MKSLKFAFAILALAIGFGASIANAQPAKKQSTADKARETYNLTNDQYQKVTDLYNKAAEQKKAISADDPDKTKKRRAIDRNTRSQFREILTPEQQAKYDENSKKRSEAKGKKKGAKKDKKQ